MRALTKKQIASQFRVSTAPQRSPGWYVERAGIPSASGLEALFDTLKDGRTPSAKQKSYLKRLAYERTFKVTHDQYDTQPMKDGRFFEEFAAMVYQRDTGNELFEAFSYISSWFVATPDKHVLEVATKKRGLLECKVVGDETFMDILENGIPLGHELQTQGQLMATGLDWVDYIVVNIKTKAYTIIRQHRNNKLIKRIYERLHEPLNLPKLDTENVKQFDELDLQGYIDGSAAINAAKPSSIIKNLPF